MRKHKTWVNNESNEIGRNNTESVREKTRPQFKLQFPNDKNDYFSLLLSLCTHVNVAAHYMPFAVVNPIRIC